jgi:hypothetical protein
MTKTRGKNKSYREGTKLDKMATFKVSIELWTTFKNRFGIKASSMLREYIRKELD